MKGNYMLEMEGISKRFGGVCALSDVSLKVLPGEIHGIVGENGAGKSTLMKILSGAYKRDTGTIFIGGSEAKINTPKDATNLGVSVIYQEFMLAPDLTVAENIYIDKLTGGSAFINWKKLCKDAKAQLESLGFSEIDPAVKVGTLSVAYQQVVEICKCLTRKSKILVFDEPSAVLTFTEIEKLFAIMNQLRADGTSIIYISHRLDEIYEMCDHVTILKDGGVVDTVDIHDVPKNQLVDMMVGRALTQMFPTRNATIGKVALETKNLKTDNLVEDVSFSVSCGEVLGFSGLVGAGRTETMRAIFGLDKILGGEIFYFGEKTQFKNPSDAIANGFGLLPEDRKGQGLILEQSIRCNTTLAVLDRITGPLGWINHKKEKAYVKELLGDVATKYGSMEDNVNSLSGGNQQKVALAKWIATQCRCVVFDEPTRGVDIGAKVEIYKVINKLAESGVAVIVISSEMQEIMGICDRAVVMHQGRVSGELQKHDLTENNLIKLAMGV